MKKLTFAMLFITFILFLGIGTFSNNNVVNTDDSVEVERDVYLNIMTCNKMQYEMTKVIVGDKHNVEYMFSSEDDSKNFLYNNETIDNISNMNLFLYSSDILEPWSSELISKLNKSSVGTINITRGIRTTTMQYEGSSQDNPYYYAGLEEYKVMLYNIKAAIQEKDPKNRDLYEENYNEAVSKIDESIAKITENKVDLGEYQYIALDDNLDYFYRGLGISVTKVTEGQTIASTIAANNMDATKVIVLKDINTVMTEEGYNVVNLLRYDSGYSVEDMILKNYSSFYALIKNNDDK